MYQNLIFEIKTKKFSDTIKLIQKVLHDTHIYYKMPLDV